MRFLRNHQGFSVVELLVSAGLAALIIGMSSIPIIQMRGLEKKVEFVSSLDIAHQLALQKARNGTFLKAALGIAPGNAVDKCYGGRGVGCAAYAKDGALIESGSSFKKSASDSSNIVTSEVRATVACTATKCTTVSINVSTRQPEGTHNNVAPGWMPKPLVANFSVPAAALASRQEIDFSHCKHPTTGERYVITGINYETLRADCEPFTGMKTCDDMTGSGPMASFGGSVTAANCQPAVNSTCPSGMSQVGMINGQAVCAPPEMDCVDPLSSNCTTGTTVCTPNWQPLASTKCLGEDFTQSDSNNCPASTTQTARGTNALRCAPSTCNYTGTLKWPDATNGPCEVAVTNLSADAGTSAWAGNAKPGFYGSFTVACQDNAPAASTYNFAAAAKTCEAVMCSDVPVTANWSTTGWNSALPIAGVDSVGPWACAGPVTTTQTAPAGVPAPTAGQLLAVEATATARAVASNTNPGITSGGLTMTCSDSAPGNPAPHAGVLNISGVSCVSSAAPGCPAVAARSCSDNFRDFGLEHNTGALPASLVGQVMARDDFAFTDSVCDKGFASLISDCTCLPAGTWSCVQRGSPIPPSGDCSIQWYVKPFGPTNDTELAPGASRVFGSSIGFTYKGASLVYEDMGAGNKKYTCPLAPACPAGQIMGYRWTVSFMQAPDTVTWDAIGGTNLFAATEAELTTAFWDACNAFVGGMTTKRKCELEKEPAQMCGVPTSGSVPSTPTIPPAAKCWEGAGVYTKRGLPSGACEDPVVAGFTGVQFKTFDACVDTAQSYPPGMSGLWYSGTCFGGPTRMCREVSVADASTCSDRVSLAAPSGGTWKFAGSGCTDMFPDPGPYCSVVDEDKPCPTLGSRCRIPQGFGDGSCADGMMIHLQCR